MEGQQVDVPWVRHGHERRGGQGMEAVQPVFWKKHPMHRYVPLASEGRGGPPAASRLCVKWRPWRSGQCASMGHEMGMEQECG
jgi:hypothetical protein